MFQPPTRIFGTTLFNVTASHLWPPLSFFFLEFYGFYGLIQYLCIYLCIISYNNDIQLTFVQLKLLLCTFCVCTYVTFTCTLYNMDIYATCFCPFILLCMSSHIIAKRLINSPLATTHLPHTARWS